MVNHSHLVEAARALVAEREAAIRDHDFDLADELLRSGIEAARILANGLRINAKPEIDNVQD